jgi:acyl-CoA thioesterase-1
VSLAWLAAERLQRKALEQWQVRLRIAVVALWLAGAAAEAPYHFTPTIKTRGHPTVYLFGDSVSAGMGEAASQTWPHLLAESRSIDVRNYSQMGATVRTALRKAEAASLGEGIVLLEIGGNDLLGHTSPRDFERDLDALLTRLGGPGRVVVMFELPLPPLANEFGRVQRRLADKHEVQLIPKRVFLRVLTAGQGTVDSIHLSRQGHELMAEKVWQFIEPAYRE